MKRNIPTIIIALIVFALTQNIQAQLIRSIKINKSNIEDYRDSLRIKVFGQKTLPAYMPDSVYTNVDSLKYVSPFPYTNILYPAGNLDSVDCYAIKVGDSCTTNYCYVYHPHVNNGNLFIYHSGHCIGNTTIEDWNNGGEHIRELVAQGYTVLTIPMIFYKSIPPMNYDNCSNHHYEVFADHGFSDTIVRAFFKSSVASLNQLGRNNFDTISMMGLSGGGWTVSIYAAMDTMIQFSFPTSGSMPMQLWPNTNVDYEQGYPQIFQSNFLNFEDMYVLGAAGYKRKMLQSNARYDDCCFMGLNYIYYIDSVKARLKEMGYPNQYEFYLDETHIIHMISAKTFQVYERGLNNDELYFDTVPSKVAIPTQLYSFNIKTHLKSATGVDTSTLKYSLTIAPAWLSIDTITGILSGTVPANFTVDTISFKAEDTLGNFIMCDYRLTNLSIANSISKATKTEELINIFPNPSNGSFTLQISSSVAGLYSVEIRNTLGQVIYADKISTVGASLQKTISLPQETKGLYTLIIWSEDKKSVSKLIIN